jgi:hypothetical protein
MAAIIAFMISIGVILTAEEATPTLIDQYEDQYHQSIIVEDVDTM